jgi:regulator of replication initiation timing
MPIGELRIKLEKLEAENAKLRTEKKDLRAQLRSLSKELAVSRIASVEEPAVTPAPTPASGPEDETA